LNVSCSDLLRIAFNYGRRIDVQELCLLNVSLGMEWLLSEDALPLYWGELRWFPFMR
jgi:hypothetical protein